LASLHGRALPCNINLFKLTPLLTPESGRHSLAELAILPPGWVRPGESLAVAERATTGHHAWPCCSLVKLFAATNITECDTSVERLRPTLRRSRSFPAIAMPPQTSSMRTCGAFDGGKGIYQQLCGMHPISIVKGRLPGRIVKSRLTRNHLTGSEWTSSDRMLTSPHRQTRGDNAGPIC